MRPRIEVTIGELVLIGVPGQSGQRIGGALKAELVRLLSGDRRPVATGGHRPSRTTEIHLAPGETSDRVGVRLAQAIHRGLTP